MSYPDSSTLDAAVDCLKSKHRYFEVTNWKYMLILWNDNNEEFAIPDDTEMPEYDYDTIVG